MKNRLQIRYHMPDQNAGKPFGREKAMEYIKERFNREEDALASLVAEPLVVFYGDNLKDTENLNAIIAIGRGGDGDKILKNVPYFTIDTAKIEEDVKKHEESLGDYSKWKDSITEIANTLKDHLANMKKTLGLNDEYKYVPEDGMAYVASGDTMSIALGKMDTALVGIQKELDNTQAGAGLNEDGSYKTTEANIGKYIEGATSLFEADLMLDAQLNEVDAQLKETKDKTDKNFDVLDRAINGAGFNSVKEDSDNYGRFTVPKDTNFINGQDSLKKCDEKLDEILHNVIVSGGYNTSNGKYEKCTSPEHKYIKDAESGLDADKRLDSAIRGVDSKFERIIGRSEERKPVYNEIDSVKEATKEAKTLIALNKEANHLAISEDSNESGIRLYTLSEKNIADKDSLSEEVLARKDVTGIRGNIYEPFKDNVILKDATSLSNADLKLAQGIEENDARLTALEGVKLTSADKSIAIKNNDFKVNIDGNTIIRNEDNGVLSVSPNAFTEYTAGNGIKIEDSDARKKVSLNLKDDDKILSLDGNALKSSIGLDRRPVGKIVDALTLIDKEGNPLGEPIDVSDFVKDGMLEGVKYDSNGKKLIFTFNTAAKKEVITINVTDMLPIYNAGTGLELTNQEDVKIFKAKRDKNSEDYLVITDDGIAVKGVGAAIGTSLGEAKNYADELKVKFDQKIAEVNNTVNNNSEKIAKINGGVTEKGSFDYAVNVEKLRAIDSENIIDKKIEKLNSSHNEPGSVAHTIKDAVVGDDITNISVIEAQDQSLLKKVRTGDDFFFYASNNTNYMKYKGNNLETVISELIKSNEDLKEKVAKLTDELSKLKGDAITSITGSANEISVDITNTDNGKNATVGFDKNAQFIAE